MVDYLKLEHKGDWDPLRPVEEKNPPELASDDTSRQSREVFLEKQVADGQVRLFCVEYGLAHFQAKDWALHSIFRQEVAECYSKEGIRLMAITSEDYRREAREKLMAEATVEERLKGLDAEQRRKGLDPDEWFQGLGPEQRLKGLDPESALRVLFPKATEAQIQEFLLRGRDGQ